MSFIEQTKVLAQLAFTMAEILISLTIIGIIAAITLPALQANINEKAWAAQRKALYSRMSQAISMMPSLNGYGEYAGTWNNNNVTTTKDTAAAVFLTDGLSKVLKINNICSVPIGTSGENAHNELKKCGIPSKISTMGNSKIDFPTKLSELNSKYTGTTSNDWWNYANPQKDIDTNVGAFNTINGESVAVFYNPYCVTSDFEPRVSNGPNLYDNNIELTVAFPWICANFVYDLNGIKGPNKVGKDIGVITALYATDTLVSAPFPLEKNAKVPNGSTYGISQDLASQACRIQDKDSRVPTLEEAILLQLNSKFYNIASAIWTSKTVSSTAAYRVSNDLSIRYESKTLPYYVRCVKH